MKHILQTALELVRIIMAMFIIWLTIVLITV